MDCNDVLCEMVFDDVYSHRKVRVEVSALDLALVYRIEISESGSLVAIFQFCDDTLGLRSVTTKDCKILYSCSDGKPKFSLINSVDYKFVSGAPAQATYLCSITPRGGEFTIVP